MSAIGTLVIRLGDDSGCPLVGEVVAEVGSEHVAVVWGDDRDTPEPARWAWTEAMDDLMPCGRPL